MVTLYVIFIISSVNCNLQKLENEALTDPQESLHLLDKTMQDILRKINLSRNLLFRLIKYNNSKQIVNYHNVDSPAVTQGNIHGQPITAETRFTPSPKNPGVVQPHNNITELITTIPNIILPEINSPATKEMLRYLWPKAFQNSSLSQIKPVPSTKFDNRPLKVTSVSGYVPWRHVTRKTTPSPDPFISKLKNEMSEHNSGYLSVAFGQLCEQIAVKDARDVEEVVRHAGMIISRKISSLSWMEEPMVSILWNVMIKVSDMPTDVLQSYSIMLSFMMQHRQESFSFESIKVLDFAEQFFTDVDGRLLFELVKEFRGYPKGTRSGENLATAIIEAFEKPYIRHGLTGHRQNLVNQANKLLKERFPNQNFFKRIQNNEEISPQPTRNTPDTSTINMDIILRHKRPTKNPFMQDEYRDDEFIIKYATV